LAAAGAFDTIILAASRFHVRVPVSRPSLQAFNLQRKVEQAILEIFDTGEIGKPAAIGNSDAQAGKILAGCSDSF